MKKQVICLLALALPVCLSAQQPDQTQKHLLKSLDRQIKQQVTGGLHRAATEELLRLLKSPQAQKTPNLEKHVRRLVAAGANVNGQDADGNRVFYLALRTGDADTVKFLVREGVSFANQACVGAGGDYLTSLAVKALCKDRQVQPQQEPLIFQSDVELAKFFRNRNDKYSRPSMRALAEAVDSGNTALAQYFVDWFGVNIAQKGDGQTALHELAERNNLEGVRFLLQQGANPTARNINNNTPADLTTSAEIKQVLQEAADKWRLDFPLHRAVRKNDVAAAQALIDAGADVNEALASDARTPLIDAARFNQKEAVELLLKNGADVNKASYQGYTPLHWTVLQSNGKLSMVKRLVAAGADVNAVDEKGNTAFYYAVKYQRDGIVDYLLKQGANPNIKNKDGESAGEILARRAAEAAQAQMWDNRYR